MTNAAEQLVKETPTAQLASVVRDLDEPDALAVRDAFGAMLGRVAEWQTEARGLVVTSEEQTGKMARARLLRLEIRKVRVELDKRRKALKSGIVLKGRAIDGAYAIFEAMASPLEDALRDAETFAERAEAKRRDDLASARRSALSALGVTDAAMPGALGALDEATWLDVERRAVEARDAQQRAATEKAETDALAAKLLEERRAKDREEAARVTAEKAAQAEAQRVDNERLRAEAVEREKATQAERDALLEERRVERERLDAERQAERVKHEAELAVLADDRRKVQAELDAAKKIAEAPHDPRTCADCRSVVPCPAHEASKSAAAGAAKVEPVDDRRTDDERIAHMVAALRAATLPTFDTTKGQSFGKRVRAKLDKLADDVVDAWGAS